MHPVLEKTFGGLTKAYYFRQLFFGAIFAAFLIAMAMQPNGTESAEVYVMAVVSALLYPYSRFVYESVIDFVIGNNVFFVNALFMMMAKLFTMAMCFAFAIFIAPVGLAYLYYHHSKQN